MLTSSLASLVDLWVDGAHSVRQPASELVAS
jgi:hypothetical protein